MGGRACLIVVGFIFCLGLVHGEKSKLILRQLGGTCEGRLVKQSEDYHVKMRSVKPSGRSLVGGRSPRGTCEFMQRSDVFFTSLSLHEPCLLRRLRDPAWKPKDGGLVVSKIPGSPNTLTNKANLKTSLTNLEEFHSVAQSAPDASPLQHKVAQLRESSLPLSQYLPTTYEFPSQIHLLMEDAEMMSKPIIVRPEAKCCGIDVSVHKNTQEFLESIDYFKEPDERQEENNKYYTDKWVISKYIINPLLYYGYKWHIRCNIMVLSISPLVVVSMSNVGAWSMTKYETNFDNQTKTAVLTNVSVNKVHPRFPKSGQVSLHHLSTFNDAFDLNEAGLTHQDIDQMWLKLYKIILDTVLAYEVSDNNIIPSIDPDKDVHFYEIFGYDFLPDTSGNIWLMEVNDRAGWCSPGYLSTYSVPDPMPVFMDTIINAKDIIREHRHNGSSENTIASFVAREPLWEILFDETQDPPYYITQHLEDIEKLKFKPHLDMKARNALDTNLRSDLDALLQTKEDVEQKHEKIYGSAKNQPNTKDEL